jgi:hypothetical protein
MSALSQSATEEFLTDESLDKPRSFGTFNRDLAAKTEKYIEARRLFAHSLSNS